MGDNVIHLEFKSPVLWRKDHWRAVLVRAMKAICCFAQECTTTPRPTKRRIVHGRRGSGCGRSQCDGYPIGNGRDIQRSVRFCKQVLSDPFRAIRSPELRRNGSIWDAPVSQFCHDVDKRHNRSARRNLYARRQVATDRYSESRAAEKWLARLDHPCRAHWLPANLRLRRPLRSGSVLQQHRNPKTQQGPRGREERAAAASTEYRGGGS